MKNKEYDPEKNPDMISLEKQPDGNWIGKMQKNGTIIEVRAIGPDTAIQLLLTHE